MNEKDPLEIVGKELSFAPKGVKNALSIPYMTQGGIFYLAFDTGAHVTVETFYNPENHLHLNRGPGYFLRVNCRKKIHLEFFMPLSHIRSLFTWKGRENEISIDSIWAD